MPACFWRRTADDFASADLLRTVVERCPTTLLLANAFSKRVESHAAAIAIYFMYYNFGRVHQTFRVTPAMEAGLADHVWSIDTLVALLG